MATYKKIELDDRLVGMIRHMHAVDEYREVLQNLQAVWDNLALLGQLSGAGMDMNGTRQAFGGLTAALLNQLCSETLKKTLRETSARAQVSIDILVRNLFERTADIGFLATDEDIRAYLKLCAEGGASEADDARLRARFAEYVAKYSVYSDIVLLDTAGNVSLRLDERCTVAESRHALVAESMATTGAYVETFGEIDLLPGSARSLVYSYRVTDSTGEPLGVLCLCFRFDNELEGIFHNLVPADDWTVVTLLDADGHVIATSDPHHVPLGARLAPVHDAPYRIVRFGAQEYIAVSRHSQGYQGYAGPQWVGHVLLPLQHAFNARADLLRGLPAGVLQSVMSSTALFGDALRSIPLQAQAIQRDLNRSVWNGNVRNRSTGKAVDASFAKVLLWEVSNTGARTEQVFERSIGNLHETVVSAILEDSRFQAALAIDIMDRNLYERANDCRWWALTSAFRELLAAPQRPEDAEVRMHEVLAHINALYTVYSLLMVFDIDGRVIAVSNGSGQSHVGRLVGEAWHRRALALDDAQGYAVSDFVATPFYDDRHTYIYGAAIRAPEGDRAVGGVGIVFDAAPQFASMLRDALPRDASGAIQPGSFGVFGSPNGRVIACSDERFKPGDALPLDAGLLALGPGQDRAEVIAIDGRHYAVGLRASSGYREYKGPDDAYREAVVALIFVQLCESAERTVESDGARPAIRSDHATAGEKIEIATFRVGQKWYGLRTEDVYEAVDPTGISSVPGAGDALAGYLMFEGQPVQVFCIKWLLERRAAIDPDDEMAARQVIITRRNGQPAIGFLVDALGEIPVVSPDRLNPLPAMLAGGQVIAEVILSVDGTPDGAILPVLSTERLINRLAGNVADSAPAAIQPRRNLAA